MSAPDKPPARCRDAAPTPSLKSAQNARRKNTARTASLPLALAEPQQGDPGVPATIPLRQLWLCIDLPALPLQALLNSVEAAAVFEEQQGVRRILLANARARAAGIVPGLATNAALALLPALQLEARNARREQEVLRELAEWSGKFTSFTCIEAPTALLLEIAGSLTLFGGIRTLRERIVSELGERGFDAGVAIAPTPLAATWLARAGRKACIRDPRNLVGRLGSLPLSCLGWPESVQAALQGMGVVSVAEALRLPRQGFARRFGAARLLQFDRALGRLPDPRSSYRAAERFCTEYELNEEQGDAGLLLQVCRELLQRLERFLLNRQLAVQDIEFSFFHLQMAATRLSLGCVKAGRAVQHWFDLLEISFDRLALPAPVIAVQLLAGEGRPFTAETAVLSFNQQDKKQRNTSIAHLAERLSARIGNDLVHGVMTVAEHRPQYAWQARNTFADAALCSGMPASRPACHVPAWPAETRQGDRLVLRRPLWLLPEPRLLGSEDGVPCYQGRLNMLAGPERLETGWWDDNGIARDYFIAANPAGVHLWVYQDRGRDRQRWYLHGMFG